MIKFGDQISYDLEQNLHLTKVTILIIDYALSPLSLFVHIDLTLEGPSIVKWTKKYIHPNPKFKYGSFST